MTYPPVTREDWREHWRWFGRTLCWVHVAAVWGGVAGYTLVRLGWL